jgi:hypothetical protein
MQNWFVNCGITLFEMGEIGDVAWIRFVFHKNSINKNIVNNIFDLF